MTKSIASIAVVIPAYNEAEFLKNRLEDVLFLKMKLDEMKCKVEIIVVNDGSTDLTSEVSQNFPVSYLYQSNQGKGAAVLNGVKHCNSEFFVVLDADLEYEALDILKLIDQVNVTRKDIVVYGSRYLTSKNRFRIKPFKNQSFLNFYFSIILSVLNFVKYRVWITDLLTGLKLYPTEIYLNMDLMTKGFETDHEITCKLLKQNISIFEVPINYHPRTKLEGKKIKVIDAVKAVKEILK